MKRLLGAGVAAAVLMAPLAAVTGQQPASAQVDTDPPAIGSCHHLTYAEVRGVSSGKPPVPCTDPHTAVTFDVVEFPAPPDWNDEDTYRDEVLDQCNRSWVEVLGGNAKTITRSSYTYYWLLPTPAQRDAGAAWVRCELVALGGDRIVRLPRRVELGGLPLPDAVARCREGERADLRLTVCARPHQYRATHSVKLPWRGWRNDDAAQKFAYRECDERIRGHFYYQWPSSRYWWLLGFRYATCLRKTTD